jgi:ankyrin repeat protein
MEKLEEMFQDEQYELSLSEFLEHMREESECYETIDNDGHTALTRAAHYKANKVLSSLLSNGASSNFITHLNQNAIQLSIKRGNSSAVAFLMNSLDSFPKRSMGRALVLAVTQKHL